MLLLWKYREFTVFIVRFLIQHYLRKGRAVTLGKNQGMYRSDWSRADMLKVRYLRAELGDVSGIVEGRGN